MNTISELIEVNEIKLKTITDLIQHKETPKEDMDKLLSCRRFISSFISELKGVNESNLVFENYLTSIRNDVKKQPKNDVEKGFQIAVVLIHANFIKKQGIKGITFIPTEPLSAKSKEKLQKHSENQKKRLEKMKKDYEDGKYDNIISQLKSES